MNCVSWRLFFGIGIFCFLAFSVEIFAQSIKSQALFGQTDIGLESQENMSSALNGRHTIRGGALNTKTSSSWFLLAANDIL